MTFVRRGAPLAARALALALVGSGLVEIAGASSASELSITRGAARCAADALRGTRRRRGHERDPALGAASTHRRIVRRHRTVRGFEVDQYLAAAERPITPPRGSRSGRKVDPS